MSEKVVPVTKLEIKNFRCVYDATVDLDWFTVLIGKNDTGKTSILDALALLAANAGLRLNDWLSSAGGDLSTSVAHGRGKMKIVAHFEDQARASMEYDTAAAHNISPPTYRSPNDPSQDIPARLARTPAPYRLSPGRMRQPARTGELAGLPLPSDGYGLVDVLDRLPHKTFGRLLQEYALRIPEVDEVLPKAHTRMGRVEQGMKEIRLLLKNGDDISARQASDGAMLVLGYLAIAMDKDSPQLILIDEPENGIHPAQLEQLVQSLIDLSVIQNRVQIVMTTHSPFVLDVVDADNIRVVTRNTKEGTRVHRFAEIEEVKRKLGRGWSVGEAWVNMEDEEAPEPVK